MQGTWKACGTGNQPISKLHIKVLVTNYWLFCWESFVWMQLQHCIREPQRYFYSPYIWISWWRNWSLERLSVSCLRVNRWVITKSLKTQLTVTCSWWQIRSMILLAHQDFLIEMERLKVTIKFLAWTPGRMAVSLIEIRNTVSAVHRKDWKDFIWRCVWDVPVEIEERTIILIKAKYLT